MTASLAASLSLASSAALQSALHVARGGAMLAAASGAVSLANKAPSTAALMSLRGGAVNRNKKETKAAKPLLKTAEGKSVLCMAAGMALHYLGYSLARPITVAFFTSASKGYAGNPGAYPFAMAFVSPVALALLMGYGKVLQVHGPRGALNRCTLFCASGILAACGLIELLQDGKMQILGIPAIKYITGPLFVFRESYVQLLTSQYWSFMASVLSPDQAARWFAPISGLTSIASAIGGMAVSRYANKTDLARLLSCTGIALVLSLFATNAAYTIAETNGFAPTQKEMERSAKKNKGKKKQKDDEVKEGDGIFKKTSALFARVPVLQALFFEILASQGLATLLNVVFVHSLGASIPDDKLRASWVGNFYALINIVSMTLQFGVLPFLMQAVEPRDLWRSIPILSCLFTTFQACHKNPTLHIVSTSLLVMKVLEYTARRMLDEMVYVPLDFESRFVGKEIIGVFGYRFGKSLMSLSLSGMTSIFGNFSVRQLSIMCNVVAVAWLKSAWTLSNLVPTRQQAQNTYTESRR